MEPFTRELKLDHQLYREEEHQQSLFIYVHLRSLPSFLPRSRIRKVGNEWCQVTWPLSRCNIHSHVEDRMGSKWSLEHDLEGRCLLQRSACPLDPRSRLAWITGPSLFFALYAQSGQLCKSACLEDGLWREQLILQTGSSLSSCGWLLHSAPQDWEQKLQSHGVRNGQMISFPCSPVKE